MKVNKIILKLLLIPYRSTLMATKFKIDAVHNNTSQSVHKSHKIAENAHLKCNKYLKLYLKEK